MQPCGGGCTGIEHYGGLGCRARRLHTIKQEQRTRRTGPTLCAVRRDSARAPHENISSSGVPLSDRDIASIDAWTICAGCHYRRQSEEIPRAAGIAGRPSFSGTALQ
jgi:hypothetical protein